jgi:hypothetical protein
MQTVRSKAHNRRRCDGACKVIHLKHCMRPVSSVERKQGLWWAGGALRWLHRVSCVACACLLVLICVSGLLLADLRWTCMLTQPVLVFCRSRRLSYGEGLVAEERSVAGSLFVNYGSLCQLYRCCRLYIEPSQACKLSREAGV